MPQETPTPDITQLENKLRELESYINGLKSSAALPFCVVSPRGVITDANQRFAQSLQTSVDRVLETKLDNWIETVAAEKVISGEIEEEISVNWHTANNNEVSLLTHVRPWDKNGNDQSYFITITDENSRDDTDAQSDAERTKVGERFLQQHIRTQSILYNINDGIIFLDPDGTVDMANPRALDILELQSGEILNKNIADLSSNVIIDKLIDLLDEGECKRRELAIEPDIYLEVTTQQIGRQASPSQTIIILHDVTEKRRIEKMKLEFASVAAHQMRTPLASVRWSLETLSESIENDELLQIVRRGYKSVQQVLHVVDELLNVDRLEEGESAYSFEPVNIIELISESIEQESEARGVLDQPEINFHEPNQHIPNVRGDKEKLKIVFNNLLENAIKYTDEDGQVEIRVNIEVSSGYAGDKVRVEVSDSGIGIPKDQQDQVFSKFFRADNATDKETEGTGVGLHISKRIVEAHNGEITFESEAGQGTTFIVTLPIASDR